MVINGVVGYGVCVRNTPIDVKKTVAYQELKSLGISDGDIYIDFVRPEYGYSDRPQLEHLIATLTPDIRLDIFSIDTLLQENEEAVKENFQKLVDADNVNFLIYDFDGAILKINKDISSVVFGDSEFLKPTPYDREYRLCSFAECLRAYKKKKKSGAIKAEKRTNFSDAFKELYFAYESYQISLPKTIELLNEYLDITNKITFYLMASDYEKSYDYTFDFPYFANEIKKRCGRDILSLPKRCGGVPEDYYKIKSELDGNEAEYSALSAKERVERAMLSLGMFPCYGVWQRWNLLAKGEPKPRKPIEDIWFNENEYRSRYSKAL